jgi:transposase
MVGMTRQKVSQRLLSDQLWELLEPMIPPPPPAKNGRTGMPRVDDRAALEGILFVAANDIAWKKPPTELGYGSGITCWRRLRAWQKVGVSDKLHHAVLDQLGQDGVLDWSRASLDSVNVRAKRGRADGVEPHGPGKLGAKYHLLVTADGPPLAVAITGANRHDVMLVEPILDGLTPVKGRGRSRPRCRPVKLHADKAYDNRRVRRYLRRRGTTA